MATSNEKRMVWDPLRQALNQLGWQHQRLEDKLAVGVPDVNIHVPSQGDVWIELKCVAKLPSLQAKVNLGLRRAQYIWLRQAQRAGRTIYLLARVGDWWYLWNSLVALEMAKKSVIWSTLSSKAIGAYTTPGGALCALARNRKESK